MHTGFRNRNVVVPVTISIYLRPLLHRGVALYSTLNPGLHTQTTPVQCATPVQPLYNPLPRFSYTNNTCATPVLCTQPSSSYTNNPCSGRNYGRLTEVSQFLPSEFTEEHTNWQKYRHTQAVFNFVCWKFVCPPCIVDQRMWIAKLSEGSFISATF